MQFLENAGNGWGEGKNKRLRKESGDCKAVTQRTVTTTWWCGSEDAAVVKAVVNYG